MKNLIILLTLLTIILTGSDSQLLGQISPGKSYYIQNNSTGMYLSLASDSAHVNSLIVQKIYSGNKNQRWAVLALGNNNFVFTSKSNNNKLVVYNYSKKLGANICHWPIKKEHMAAIWKIERSSNGMYKVMNLNSYKYLGVYQGKELEGTSIVQTDDRGQEYLYWKFTPVQ